MPENNYLAKLRAGSGQPAPAAPATPVPAGPVPEAPREPAPAAIAEAPAAPPEEAAARADPPAAAPDGPAPRPRPMMQGKRAFVAKDGKAAGMSRCDLPAALCQAAQAELPSIKLRSTAVAVYLYAHLSRTWSDLPVPDEIAALADQYRLSSELSDFTDLLAGMRDEMQAMRKQVDQLARMNDQLGRLVSWLVLERKDMLTQPHSTPPRELDLRSPLFTELRDRAAMEAEFMRRQANEAKGRQMRKH